MDSINKKSVAIIGMSGRFPGANSTSDFFHNLCQGKEFISFFSEEELSKSGISQDNLHLPNYIKAKAIIEDIDLFDADFFSFTPRDAETLDPQQRLFLECAWEALEDAGYCSEDQAGKIGVYAGSGANNYYILHLLQNDKFKSMLDSIQLGFNNIPDTLCTRVSYKFNLTGPSYTIQTSCSTSLVAVIVACQALLGHQCDLALAGGVSLSLPIKSGYLYKQGMAFSPDGHCRPFDSKAEGTVGGMGIGTVVLKRLEDALADKDSIYAVIKGFAINNDGSNKIAYTAPSIIGQKNVISEAQCMAEIHPETISYVEAHGTGTQLGDPIELTALTEAFRKKTNKKQFCGIGSLKSNVGHLDAAAGVAGLIKTALSLHNRLLPPTLHFKKQNPQIDFDNSPFYVNTQLVPWDSEYPRRAGVSSFGVGGTNAHVILEEAPVIRRQIKTAEWHLFILSAKTLEALEIAYNNLFNYLIKNSHLNLLDVAFTLAIGRKSFEYRRFIIVKNKNNLVLNKEIFTSNCINERLPNLKVISKKVNHLLSLHMQDLLNENYDLINQYITKEVKSYYTNLNFFDKEKELSGKLNFLHILGELWLKGIDVDWQHIYAHQELSRISLPTYPFQRKKHWIEPDIPESSLIKSFNNNVQDNTVLTANTIEQALVKIWQSYFGITKIDLADDFFALGGDSLLAVDLVHKINQHFKSNLSPNILLMAPNIKDLAKHLRSKEQFLLPFTIVPLKKGDPSIPALFLIHPAGGTVYMYSELPAYLPSYQSVYAIQAKSLDGKSPIPKTVEEMAKDYLQDVIEVQPQGPYQLAGASFGGLVAFEMANLLRNLGQEVKFLGLIDSPHPGFSTNKKYFSNAIIKHMLEVSEEQKINLDYLRSLSTKELMNYFTKHSNSEFKGFNNQSMLFLENLYLNIEATRSYSPGVYLGSVIFFKALKASPYMPKNLPQGWEPYIPKGFKTVDIPGDHLTMHKSPNVRKLAECLQINIQSLI